MRLAKAVYCPGVDTWYVRIGPRQGVDPMFKQHNEAQAKIVAKTINATVNRELKIRGYGIKLANTMGFEKKD